MQLGYTSLRHLPIGYTREINLKLPFMIRCEDYLSFMAAAIAENEPIYDISRLLYCLRLSLHSTLRKYNYYLATAISGHYNEAAGPSNMSVLMAPGDIIIRKIQSIAKADTLFIDMHSLKFHLLSASGLTFIKGASPHGKAHYRA